MADLLNISLLQHTPTPGAIEVSLARLEEYAEKSALLGSDLLLVPEASMSGYNISVEQRDSVAEPLDGELSSAVSSLCRQYGLGISYGFVERCGDAFFNTVQLIDKTGASACYYRKTHLWGDLDRRLFSAGENYSPLIEFADWKIGQLICYDVEFPESVRHLALQGAELILISTALMSPWSTVADQIVPTRSFENHVYIAYANYSGKENGVEYVGQSCVTGPDGRDLAKAGSEPTLLTATLDKQAISEQQQAIPYHRDRRPELYQGLCKSESATSA